MNPPVSSASQAEVPFGVKLAIREVELAVLIMIGGLAAQFIFTLQPLSAAVLTWVLSVATFPLLRRKTDGATHVCWTHSFWDGLLAAALRRNQYLQERPFRVASRLELINCSKKESVTDNLWSQRRGSSVTIAPIYL